MADLFGRRRKAPGNRLHKRSTSGSISSTPEMFMAAARRRACLARRCTVFGAMSDTDRGLSSAQIVIQLGASLNRLGTDYIDLYQCHRFDEETPLDETMEALTAAVRQGKARYIGFSE